MSDFFRFRNSEIRHNESHWSVDRWWTREERIELGIEEEQRTIDLPSFIAMIADASSSLNEAAEPLQEIVAKQLGRYQYKTVSLADETLFSLSLGKRLLKKDFIEDKGDIPVYSANVFDPFVYTDESNIASFEYDYVLWGIDGIFSFNVMKKGSRFATTDHCGTIKVLNSSIDPYYLAYIWRKQGISMALIED